MNLFPRIRKAVKHLYQDFLVLAIHTTIAAHWHRFTVRLISVFVALSPGGVRGDDRDPSEVEVIPDPTYRRPKSTINMSVAVKKYYYHM